QSSHDAPIDIAGKAMDHCTAAFGDAGIEEIGTDRRGGMHMEQQDQKRRQERAAANAGHSDQKAHGETGKDIERMKGKNHALEFRPLNFGWMPQCLILRETRQSTEVW